MNSVTLALTALCVVTAPACAPVQTHVPFSCPARGGDTWTEVESAHFVLRTDLERREAEEASASLEEMLSVLSELGFGWPKEPNTRMEVVFFRKHEDGLRLVPRAAGAFMSEGLHDFERTPIALLHGEFDEMTRRVLQHELTHLLVHHAYPQAPVWLNEGFAQYYETLELKRGSATFGRLSPRRRFWSGHWTGMGSAAGEIVFIPAEEAPRAKEILDLDGGAFYGGAPSDDNTWEAEKAAKAPVIHYAAAFSLVRLFLIHPEYKAAFAEYRKMLQARQSAAAAWEKTIGRIASEKLEADYRASLVLGEEAAQRMTYTSFRSAPTGNAMSDADVHVLWARLRGWDRHDDRPGAAADLAEAAASEPSHRGLALARAALAMDDGDFAGAERALSPFARDEKDALILNALGWVKIGALSKSAKHPTVDDANRALGRIVQKLEPIATSVAALDLCARYHMARGEAAEALALEKRALEVDPTCINCLVMTAEIWNAQGDMQKALETATMALGMVPEGEQPTMIVRLIASYRRKLRSDGKGTERMTTPSAR